MSKQVISLGTAPTGVGGDTPRSANLKVISNFDELYAALGASGSPSALPAALPVANGGTGVVTMAALLAALNTLGNFARSNILGTVSQASGVPTGSIIERGSNSNGEYVKFADGTMICTGVGVTQTTSTQVGSSVCYFSPNNPYATFPATFIAAPRVSFATTAITTSFSWVGSDAGATTTTCNSRLLSYSPAAAAQVTYIAIGRWF